jgi:diacylglycerol kinase (ATP)
MIRLWKAFFYSMAGLGEAWDEPACRLEIYLLGIATPTALWLPVPHLEQLLLVGSVAAIFVVELLNTSVEAAIDRIGPERHELSRIAKDLGSAAVFAAAVYAAAVWAVLAGPALLALVSR